MKRMIFLALVAAGCGPESMSLQALYCEETMAKFESCFGSVSPLGDRSAILKRCETARCERFSTAYFKLKRQELSSWSCGQFVDVLIDVSMQEKDGCSILEDLI